MLYRYFATAVRFATVSGERAIPSRLATRSHTTWGSASSFSLANIKVALGGTLAKKYTRLELGLGCGGMKLTMVRETGGEVRAGMMPMQYLCSRRSRSSRGGTGGSCGSPARTPSCRCCRPYIYRQSVIIGAEIRVRRGHISRSGRLRRIPDDVVEGLGRPPVQAGLRPARVVTSRPVVGPVAPKVVCGPQHRCVVPRQDDVQRAGAA